MATKIRRSADSFGPNLKRLRTGMTQVEFAAKIDMQPSAINHFESGRRKPSLRNLIAIADALDVGLDVLVLVNR